MKIILFSIVVSFLIHDPAFSQKPVLKTENVIVVFKTHFDIGYTDLAGSVVNKFKTSMIEGALKVVDRTKSIARR